jgi:hypothetical protein
MLTPKITSSEAARALPLLGEMERAFNRGMSRRSEHPQRKRLAGEFDRTLTSLRMNLRSYVTSQNAVFSDAAHDDLKKISALVRAVTR